MIYRTGHVCGGGFPLCENAPRLIYATIRPHKRICSKKLVPRNSVLEIYTWINAQLSLGFKENSKHRIEHFEFITVYLHSIYLANEGPGKHYFGQQKVRFVVNLNVRFATGAANLWCHYQDRRCGPTTSHTSFSYPNPAQSNHRPSVLWLRAFESCQWKRRSVNSDTVKAHSARPLNPHA